MRGQVEHARVGVTDEMSTYEFTAFARQNQDAIQGPLSKLLAKLHNPLAQVLPAGPRSHRARQIAALVSVKHAGVEMAAGRKPLQKISEHVARALLGMPVQIAAQVLALEVAVLSPARTTVALASPANAR